jgi:basic membrane lipoprotein Med (substrate-binding protein (PBP1-ABC) superfamily)
MKKIFRFSMVSVLLLLLSAFAFAGGAQEKEEMETMEAPTTLRIGFCTPTVLEEPWNTAVLQSLDRIVAAKPHGLNVEYKINENIGFPDMERVLNELAKSGQFDMLIANSSFTDAVRNLYQKYPDVVFVYTGGGNQPIGQNAYWLTVAVHEPSYLFGVLAGLATQTDTIGIVASHPVPNETSAMNAYRLGAQSVNPDVKVKMMFIESWFDPAKAKESALAQISAGADVIYAMTYGVIQACQESGVPAFGFNVDQNSLAPDTIVSSAVMTWDPMLMDVIDDWWAYKSEGVPLSGPRHGPIRYFMKDGGNEIAPYHGWENKIVSKAENLPFPGTRRCPYRTDALIV